MKPKLRLQPTVRDFVGKYLYLGDPPLFIDNVPCIIGVDLSLRGFAVVRVPIDWMKSGDSPKEWFGSVRARVTSYPMPKQLTANQRAHRMSVLVDHTLRFIRPVWSSTTPRKRIVSEVWLEEYPFALHDSHVRSIAEVGGALKRELLKDGVRIESVHATSARKLLLGANPRQDPKDRVAEALESMGCEFAGDPDAADAFAAANVGLSRYGACVTLAPPPVQASIPGV